MNKIYLYEDFFTKEEREVFALGNLSASLFTYSTGVKAVRLKNDRGAIVLLPYMGQMIWRAEFDGYDMTMKTIFDEPIGAKEVFGETYGCFLMHCGLTAMGNPTAEDDHKPHGGDCAVSRLRWDARDGHGIVDRSIQIHRRDLAIRTLARLRNIDDDTFHLLLPPYLKETVGATAPMAYGATAIDPGTSAPDFATLAP
jgi:hypothetical protein